MKAHQWKFRRAIGAVQVLCVGAISWSCWVAVAQTNPGVANGPEWSLDAKQMAALGVRMAPVQPGMGLPMQASARVGVSPEHEAWVSAPYAGAVSRVWVAPGDAVRQGQTLATWVSPQLGELRRQGQEARLEADHAKAVLEREQALLAEGVIAASRVQSSQNRLAQAQATLKARESELSAAGVGVVPGVGATASIVSPLSGEVAQVLVTTGQRVEAGAVLFKLLDTRQMQLHISLSPDKAKQLRVGDAVDIPSRQAKAVIRSLSRLVDGSGQAQARAQVTVAGKLQVGEQLTVQLLGKAQPEDAQTGAENAAVKASGQAAGQTAGIWQLPSQAVTTQQGQSLVFAATPKGVKPVVVQVLAGQDDQVLVRSNQLDDRSQVAITGLASLRALLSKGE